MRGIDKHLVLFHLVKFPAPRRLRGGPTVGPLRSLCLRSAPCLVAGAGPREPQRRFRADGLEGAALAIPIVVPSGRIGPGRSPPSRKSQREAAMVHIRCAEQTSAMLRLQTMPGARANLCADGHTGDRVPFFASRARPLVNCGWRATAIAAVRLGLPLIRARVDRGLDGTLALPKRRRITQPIRPKFHCVQNRRRADAPGLLRRHLGSTGGQTRRSRLKLVGRRLGSGKKVLLTTNCVFRPLN